MAEHLGTTRISSTTLGPAPAGIIHHPSENGIDYRLTPEEIREHAKQLAPGQLAVSLSTPFNDSAGERPYSELRVEGQIESESEAIKAAAIETEKKLLKAASTSFNPEVRDPALATLSGSNGTKNDINLPRIADLNRELHELNLKKQRGGTLTLKEKQRIPAIKEEVRRLTKENSNPIKKRRTRKRDRAARRDMVGLGYSEEKIATTMDTRGLVSPTLKLKEKELKRREKAEDEDIRNKVGTIGRVLEGPDGKRYVVKDVEPQAAQGHMVIGYKTDPKDPKKIGDPIFEPGLDSNGQQLPPTLHDLYIKVGDTFILALRDDTYLSGLARQSSDGKFYYPDDTGGYKLANPKGIGDDSFSPVDDKVILQRLFSGEEAVDLIVNGGNPEEIAIMIGNLCHLVDTKRWKAIEDSKRDIKERVVFKVSDKVIDPEYEKISPGDPRNYKPTPGIQESGILSSFDASQGSGFMSPWKRVSGHLARFDYSNPTTTRQRVQEEYIRLIAKNRLAASLKKSIEGRQKQILG